MKRTKTCGRSFHDTAYNGRSPGKMPDDVPSESPGMGLFDYRSEKYKIVTLKRSKGAKRDAPRSYRFEEKIR